MLVLSGAEVEPEEGIDPLIEACRSAGVKAVEVWVPRNTGDDGAERVIRRLGDAGLAIACLSAGIELYRDERREAEMQQAKLLQLIRLAGRLGVPRVNTYFGFSSRRDDDALIDGYLELAAVCIEQAERNGVTIVLENEFDAFAWDPAGSDVTRRPKTLARLLDKAGSPAFKTTFDPANFVCAGVDPLHEALPLLAPHIAYVHVKNVREIPTGSPAIEGWRRYADHGRAYSTCALDDGSVDWPSLLRDLARQGYRGPFCLEPHGVPERRADSWVEGAALIRALLEPATDGPYSRGATP